MSARFNDKNIFPRIDEKDRLWHIKLDKRFVNSLGNAYRLVYFQDLKFSKEKLPIFWRHRGSINNLRIHYYSSRK